MTLKALGPNIEGIQTVPRAVEGRGTTYLCHEMTLEPLRGGMKGTCWTERLFSPVLGSIGSVEHFGDAGSTTACNLYEKQPILPPRISLSADCAEGSARGTDA
jgi:hypothetical protein